MERRGPTTLPARLVWLAQWAALAALYEAVLRPVFHLPSPADWMGALAGSLCLRLALGAFAGAARAAEDRRVLARCRAGALPQDGKRFAAAGRLAALATPPPVQDALLAAPLSGAPCIAYSYRIGGGFVGFALAPAAIAAPSGSVRLLGFPVLESGFPEQECTGDAAYERAVAYVAATSFADLDAAAAAEASLAAPAAAARTADVDGAARGDWRLGGRRSVERGDRLLETVVPEGEEVCAIGLYHAAEGGVAPDASPQGRPLRLLRGGSEAAAALLAGDGRGQAAAGLALLVVSHAAIAGIAAWLLLGRR